MIFKRYKHKSKLVANIDVFQPAQIIICIVAISVVLLAGCGDRNRTSVFADDGKLHIVCTTFPQYDWVRALTAGAEEYLELVLLTEGGDLHNFQPSAMDIAQVSDCDLLIYVGGESDLWVQDALRESVNTDMHIFNMMERIEDSLKEEEHMEGVQGHSHQESEHHHNEGAEGHGYDEHVWLSLRNTECLVAEICTELEQLDTENAPLYRANCNAYLTELQTLDNAYSSLFATSDLEKETSLLSSEETTLPTDSMACTLLFADRYPFRYLAEDYGLQCFAAFDGCSAETEASFQTVVFLVKKLEELGLDTVFVIDGSDKRLAQVVIENTKSKDQQIAVLNSMQSVTKQEIADGVTYLSIMKENLQVLQNCYVGLSQ